MSDQLEYKKFDGHRKKEMIVCPGELFGELIYEIRSNRDCGYTTYLNDAIKGGLKPSYVLALKKGDNIDEMAIREVFCSKVLNYFSSPVAYNKVVNMNNEQLLVSVNFVGDDERFMTLLDGVVESQNYNVQDLTEFDKVSLAKNIFTFDFLCDSAIEMIGSGLNGVKKQLGECENFDKLKNDFIEDYIYSYLIRKYLFYDSDFYFQNVGIIMNDKDKTFRMSPNFDFELSSMLITNEKYLANDIKYVIQHYPHIATKFYEKLKYLIIPTENFFGPNKSKFEEMIDESVYGDNRLKEILMTKIKGNILRTKEIVGDELGKSCIF